jgi:hypothetical protein
VGVVLAALHGCRGCGPYSRCCTPAAARLQLSSPSPAGRATAAHPNNRAACAAAPPHTHPTLATPPHPLHPANRCCPAPHPPPPSPPPHPLPRAQHYKAHSAAVTQLAFHPTGSFLLTSSLDTSLRVWDLREGQLLYTLHGHEGATSGVAFSPAGDYFASAGARASPPAPPPAPPWPPCSAPSARGLRADAAPRAPPAPPQPPTSS